MWPTSAFAALVLILAGGLGRLNAQHVKTYRKDFPLHNQLIQWELVPWKEYHTIIVTGPRRSGSAFFAKALAEHLDYRHVDSTSSYVLSEKNGAPLAIFPSSNIATVAKIDQKVVLERPSWAYLQHKFPKLPGTFVAFMGRNCLEVYASENRVQIEDKQDTGGWSCRYGRERESMQYRADTRLSTSVSSTCKSFSSALDSLFNFPAFFSCDCNCTGLATSLRSGLYDLMCTIKQAAYMNFQRAEMKRNGIDSEAISFTSLSTMKGFVNGLPPGAKAGNRTKQVSSLVVPKAERQVGKPPPQTAKPKAPVNLAKKQAAGMPGRAQQPPRANRQAPLHKREAGNNQAQRNGGW